MIFKSISYEFDKALHTIYFIVNENVIRFKSIKLNGNLFKELNLVKNDAHIWKTFSKAFFIMKLELRKKRILLFPVIIFCCYYNTRRIHIISPNIHTPKVLTLLTHFYSARNFSNKFNHLSKDINGMNTHGELYSC